MKIAVYGAGGVGAYFGGRLARAGADVHPVARGTHLEALHGAVVRKGREHGVAVPTTETVYAILRPWAARNRGDE